MNMSSTLSTAVNNLTFDRSFQKVLIAKEEIW